jgi:hypothetical protein
VPNVTTPKSQIDAPSAAIHAAPVIQSRLEFHFSIQKSATDFAASVVGLLFGAADARAATDDRGHRRDDLDAAEIQQRIRAHSATSVEFGLSRPLDQRKVAISLQGATATLELPLRLGSATSLLWLQDDTGGPFPVLSLPIDASVFVPDAAHAFVALAARIGEFSEARLYTTDQNTPDGVWSQARGNGEALPLISSFEDTVWTTAEDVKAVGQPVAWFLPSRAPSPEVYPTPSSEWWTRFGQLVNSAATFTLELEAHLKEVALTGVPWRLAGLAAAARADYVTAVENGVVSVLVPHPDEVVVAVDLHLSADVVGPVLLHAMGHLFLGHVQPGDKWAHWDTLQTVTSAEPHRQWDRDAREYVTARLARFTSRQINSIEDCTTNEKAQLGLWRMIGEMLGESRTLHPAAERYQNAAYQRQAASRLVAMLEDYGGAMLCDGVGLGKTYVATTLMVHYANKWRDQWASSPERLLEDPFRISVLAPNSVVSTWLREALPALASYGVPLATIRVISHTNAFSRRGPGVGSRRSLKPSRTIIVATIIGACGTARVDPATALRFE